jgi:hypothetical protein
MYTQPFGSLVAVCSMRAISRLSEPSIRGARDFGRDGVNWEKSVLDSDGNTGLYPNLVIDPTDGRPAVIYYRCSDDPLEPECDRNEDGLRYAVFKGAYPEDLGVGDAWLLGSISSEADAFDGVHASADVLSDGSIGVAYAYEWINQQTMEVDSKLLFRMGGWE